MHDEVLLDNDIVLKICCFRLVNEFTDFFARNGRSLWVLGVAKFVLRKRIAKSDRISDRARASTALDRVLAATASLEPDGNEIVLAAELEAYAQTIGAALDPGESLLFAVLVRRSARLLITGDKRAIEAIDEIASALDLHDATDGHVVCLEQIVLTLYEILGPTELRARICAEPLIDRAMAICFSCAASRVDDDSVLEGLRSYLASLRSRSGAVLIAGVTLSVIA